MLVEILREIVVRYVLGMSKKKWSSGIDVRTLSGAEWLRLLTGETKVVALIGWCGQCRVGECYQESCSRCGEALIVFDEPFWAQIGRKIRRALQKNRTLLSRVKSERESLYGTMHPPTFPAPLAWLHALWEQTSPPPHQPFVPQIHYQVANWVESLQGTGLSKEEIIEVLGESELSDAPNREKRKDYGKLSKADLLQLRMKFRQSVRGLPGSVKGLPEMWRTLKWVDRQRTTPMARLRGERVRERNYTED
jgi:hypothetical protein